MDGGAVLKKVIGYELSQDIPSNARFIGTGNKRVDGYMERDSYTVPVFYYEVPEATSSKSKNTVDWSNDVKSIVEYLNFRTGKNFKHKTEKTKSLIIKWLNTGYNQKAFQRAIDNMCDRWLGDDKMQQYLRPETLFGTKFEGYYNAGEGVSESDVFGELDGILDGI